MCECVVFTADIDKPNGFLLFFFFFVLFSSIVVVADIVIAKAVDDFEDCIEFSIRLDYCYYCYMQGYKCCVAMCMCVCVAIIHSNALALVRSLSFAIDKMLLTITINRAPTNQHKNGGDSIPSGSIYKACCAFNLIYNGDRPP